MQKDEIVIYQSDDKSIHLEVHLEDETVWLSQNQMLELFQSTKQNIGLLINNIFKEGELIENSVVKYSLTTASYGKNYKTKTYNLDVIIYICASLRDLGKKWFAFSKINLDAKDLISKIILSE